MLSTLLRYMLIVGWLPLMSAVAHAGPVSDVAGWAQRFQDAALHSDFEAMQTLLTDASDPRVKMDHALDPVVKIMSGQKVVSVEQFNNQDLGSFFKRVNFAVLLEHSIYFYSFEFAKEVDGWQILGFGADGNVNHILARQWPN